MARSPTLVGVPALLLIGVLAWPLLFSNSYFTIVWVEHLWFMWQQSLAIRADHLPSLFLNYTYGVFYPHYAFYGGTLYALAGTLSLLLGNAPMETYILTYLLGFAAAYGGWYWLARNCGLGRWWAHAPGLVFITSSYYLTLIYARGAWPEFIAVSMIPLTIAAGLSVLRADRLRARPALALTIGCVFFFGSHSLTLVWGSTILTLAGLAIVVCVPRARREVTRRSAIRVTGLVVPALLLNAWFLLPAAAYEANTVIATEYPGDRLELRDIMPLVSASHLFTLSRAPMFAQGTDFALSLPILVIFWALVSLAIFLRRGLRDTWTRVLLICSAFTAFLIVLMTHIGLLLALPRAYSMLQFSFRLESYVLLALSGTVLAVLVLAKEGGRRVRLWRWMLLPVLIVSVVGAIQQTDAYPKAPGRYEAFGSLPRIELSDYVDVRLRSLNYAGKQPPEVDFAPTAVRDNRISLVVHLRPGELVYTNLQGPPSLVHVTGARIAGVNRDDYDVLEIGSDARAGRQSIANGGASPTAKTIALSPADSLPVALGRILTLGAMAILILQFGALAIRHRRERRSIPSARVEAIATGTDEPTDFYTPSAS
jgi:hypothetical protein